VVPPPCLRDPLASLSCSARGSHRSEILAALELLITGFQSEFDNDSVDLVEGLSYTPTMPVTINVHAAKTQFSKLLARVIAGEEIIIAKAGRPVARLAPIGRQTAKKRVAGIDRGKIRMSKDFDVMTARELEDWYRTDNRLK